MAILIACEESQRICNAFRERGHKAFSCDIQEPSGEHPECHIQGDVLRILNPTQISKSFYGIVFRTLDGVAHKIEGSWDLIIAHPPCTFLTVAANRWYNYAKFCDEVNKHVIELIKELNPKYYFIENPVGGLRKMSFIQGLPRYTTTYCQYGERRQKPTDLWTNHPDPQFAPPCKRGAPCHDAAPRGSQTGTQGLKNAVEKARIPKLLCEHIVNICEMRCCSVCGKPMREGYVVNDGEEYYCSEDCLHTKYTEEEYSQMCDNDTAYWTTWELGF